MSQIKAPGRELVGPLLHFLPWPQFLTGGGPGLLAAPVRPPAPEDQQPAPAPSQRDGTPWIQDGSTYPRGHHQGQNLHREHRVLADRGKDEREEAREVKKEEGWIPGIPRCSSEAWDLVGQAWAQVHSEYRPILHPLRVSYPIQGAGLSTPLGTSCLPLRADPQSKAMMMCTESPPSGTTHCPTVGPHPTFLCSQR